MVLKVPPQPDSDMLSAAGDLKFAESELLEKEAFGAGASIWKCATITLGGIGFWVGNLEGNGDIRAYLALINRNLGDLSVLEAKKGWTEEAWRKKGFGRALLQTAAKMAPLLSDSDGMTILAYEQWSNAPGFRRRWRDMDNKCFVDDSAVPDVDRFTYYDSGRRWSIVMELDTDCQ